MLFGRGPGRSLPRCGGARAQALAGTEATTGCGAVTDADAQSPFRQLDLGQAGALQELSQRLDQRGIDLGLDHRRVWDWLWQLG